MKKIVILICGILVSSLAFAQAKKPTIMVIPSDAWCLANGYVKQFPISESEKVNIPDYVTALQGSPDLLIVIGKINEMMASRGFPLKNLESVLKSLNAQQAEDEMLVSTSGSEVAETPVERLKKVAKADILMQITWTVNTSGPKRSVTFNIQGLDAYTNKQIAGASGTGLPSFSAEIPMLLEEAVIAHLDNYNQQLQSHFDDMFQNGREVTLRIKTWNNWGKDLDTDIDGALLSQLIEDWVAENTVKNRFNTTDATEHMMLFEQVRIPLFYDRNGQQRALDTRSWVLGLKKHLSEVYHIESKLMMQGLGQAQLVLGEK